VKHKEARSAAINNPDNVAQIKKVRYLCTQYAFWDILNIDETGLNWKRTPDRTFETKSYSSTKKSKDRITIALTSNTVGSEWMTQKPKAVKKPKAVNDAEA
jgi:hypothetical protein